MFALWEKWTNRTEHKFSGKWDSLICSSAHCVNVTLIKMDTEPLSFLHQKEKKTCILTIKAEVNPE